MEPLSKCDAFWLLPPYSQQFRREKALSEEIYAYSEQFLRAPFLEAAVGSGPFAIPLLSAITPFPS